jgi:hypothetical protein
MKPEMPQSPSAIGELLRFVDTNTTMRNFFSKPQDYAEFSRMLKKFLSATMDQVRTNDALACTRKILAVSDIDDFELFREGVWKREATGVIKYLGQRDHTAHTLNNWLLGWYLYSELPPVRKAMDSAIARRKWKREDISSEQFFGHAWLFTSLLHDIGYLFEGSLGTMDTGYQSEQAAIGLRAVDEYFHFWFWKHMKVDAADDRSVVLDESQSLPVIPGEPSLTRIAMYLRTLDIDMAPLHKVLKEKASKSVRSLLPADGLPADAFELWKLHFRSFGQESVALRIESLEAAFIDHVTKELPGAGIRVLDHGVCSGLLQLKIATFFYRLFASLERKVQAKSTKPSARRTAEKLLNREHNLDNPYDFEFWWSGVVWATASAALHNMQQQGKWPDGHARGPLALDEEPLTYLGVLVDCLQDWDRYFVFHSPSKAPIQGIDVQLRIEKGKAVVSLPADKMKRANDLRKELDAALKDWKDLVELQPIA